MNIYDFIEAARENRNISDYNEYGPNNNENWPELWNGYREAVRQFERICTHSTSDKFPRKIFEAIVPESPENNIDYLEVNYEPTTQPVFTDFVNTILRGVNNIRVDDKNVRDEVWDYLYKDLPRFSSIDHFFSNIATPIALNDPMGIFAIRPEFIETTEDGDREVITGEINPTIYYYECWRVINYVPDTEVLVLTSEKSIIDVAGKMKPYGMVFEKYTKDAIIRYEQTGKLNDNTFEEVVWFPHEMDMCMAFRIGGNPKMVNNKIHYISPFYPAVAPLNEAMKDNAFLAVQKRKSAFATAVRVVNDCAYVDPDGHSCNGGVIAYMDDDGEFHERKCVACNGTGKEGGLSPFKDMHVPATEDGQPTGYNANNMLAYVSPPVETFKLLREEIERDLREARSVLHIEKANVESGKTIDRTATEAGIDLKQTVAFIMPEVNLLTDRKQLIADLIVQMKFGDGVEAPKYMPPKHIDLKTPTDYLNDLKIAEEAQLPPVIKTMILRDYLEQVFVTSDQTEKLLDAIMYSDRFFERSPAEMAMIQTAAPWERVLHDSAYSIASTLLLEDERFAELEVAQQIQRIQDRAKALAPTSSAAQRIEDILDLGGET